MRVVSDDRTRASPIQSASSGSSSRATAARARVTSNVRLASALRGWGCPPPRRSNGAGRRGPERRALLRRGGRSTVAAVRRVHRLGHDVDPEREPVDLNDVILEVLKSFREEMHENNVIARTELATELPTVEGHRGQLRQVIFNLVNNSLEAMEKATGRRRTLLVRTELKGRDAIAVTVEDSGPGIDPKRLDGIFEAFVTTKSHGMGLGLAICRAIVERHGGQLSAVSDGKHGAKFTFALPIGFSYQESAGTK